MDVRCTRCGTAYRFDDGKVSQTGITLRCSTCGHVFSLVPPVAISTSAAFEPSEPPAVLPPLPAVAPSMPGAPGRDREPLSFGSVHRARSVLVGSVLGVVVALAAVVALLQGRASSSQGSRTEAADAGAGTQLDPAEAAFLAQARAALVDDRREPIDAARAALAAAPPSPRLLASQARLDVALAAHAREEARLHDVLSRADLAAVATEPPDQAAHVALAAQRRADAASLLATAYASLTRARADGRRLAEVHLASAAYQTEKRAWAEVRVDLQNAEALGGHDPTVRAELEALQALAEGATGLRDDPAAAQARLAAVRADGRVAALRASLAVAALVPAEGGAAPPEDARAEAKALVDALPQGEPRAQLLGALLERLRLLAEASAVQLGTPEPADLGPAAKLKDASYEVVMQHAERARLNERSRDAWELFSLAARKRPDVARPRVAAGWAALDLGRKSDAMTSFRLAIALDDELAEAWFGLAEAANFSARREDAADAYRRYLELEPSGKDADVARRALAALE